MDEGRAGARETARSSYPPGPEGLTVYVVGDIHGRLDLLLDVHGRIDKDKRRRSPGQAVEVYLGDYIDRGPESAPVVSRLIERANDVHAAFLRGNHEQLFLDFLVGHDCLREWSAVGGLATLLSYGVPPELISRRAVADAVRQSISERLPEGHKRFYDQTGSYLRIGPYLAVHAGIRPGIALEKQTTEDLLSIRRDFLDHQGDFGCIVVHGHTPVMEPEPCRNRINIDTGAFATNRLTCLRIDPDGVGIVQDEGCLMLARPS
jgi:serine/threonine protein phosphatase 1